MTFELEREILDLIESPELHEYLIKYTERLRLRDYVSIIAGAPISLKRKQRLLHRLEATSDLKQQMDYIKLCCECVDLAVRYLTMEREVIFLIQLMGYDDNNKSEVVDGPYLATSLESAKRAVCDYYFDEEPGIEWQTLYWRMELYVIKQSENKKAEFLSPEYTYIMDKEGEVQYFIHKRKSLNYLKGPIGSMVEEQFHLYPDLNLPVPYQPGDVLFIDCRPYAPGAFYCMLKEVGDDCCGIQCEYVDEKGKVETGALKHGDYFFNHREVYQYLSPLYRAKIVSKDKLNWEDYIRRKLDRI